MKYTLLIQDHLLKIFPARKIEIESSTAMEAHKDVYFSQLSDDESIIEIRDDAGEVVYESKDGFSDTELI